MTRVLWLALALTACNKTDVQLGAFANCDKFDAYMKKMAKREAAFQWNSHGGFIGGVTKGFSEDMALESAGAVAPRDAGTAPTPTQFSQTNLQEEGIDEDDLMKTDGTLLYHLAGGEVVISRIFPVDQAAELSHTKIEGSPTGLFLVGDHVYVLSNLGWDQEPAPESEAVTDWRHNVMGAALSVLDVSDPTTPELVRQTYLTGSMREARIVDGMLYVVTYEDLQVGDSEARQAEALQAIKSATFEDYETWRMDNRKVEGLWEVDDGPACNCEDTYASSEQGGTYITTVTAVDLADPLAAYDAAAVVGAADVIYATNNSLYVAYNIRQNTAFTSHSIPQDTVVHKFDVSGNSPAYLATAQVLGSQTDQFAIKEQEDGTLFVATTDMDTMTSRLTALEEDNGTFHEVGSVDGLAPGETIMAARFIGDLATIVTWEVQMGDPLFTIDISDPANMVVGGELEVTGWSDYLHPMENDRLLAVGMDQGSGWETRLSVSIFDVSDIQEPVLQDRILLDAWNSEAQSEHHAFNYFPPTQSLTIPSWRNEGTSVLEVIHADPAEALASRGRITADFGGDDEAYCTNVRRSVIVDETAWALSGGGLIAANVMDPTEVQARIEYDDIDPCAGSDWNWGWGWE